MDGNFGPWMLVTRRRGPIRKDETRLPLSQKLSRKELWAIWEINCPIYVW